MYTQRFYTESFLVSPDKIWIKSHKINNFLKAHFNFYDLFSRFRTISFYFISGKLFYIRVDEKSGRYLCPQCNNPYKYRKNLYRHVRWECGKPAQFHCDKCAFTCKRKDHLEKHGCGKDVYLTCFFCKYRSKWRSDLKKHVLQKHLQKIEKAVMKWWNMNIM